MFRKQIWWIWSVWWSVDWDDGHWRTIGQYWWISIIKESVFVRVYVVFVLLMSVLSTVLSIIGFVFYRFFWFVLRESWTTDKRPTRIETGTEFNQSKAKNLNNRLDTNLIKKERFSGDALSSGNPIDRTWQVIIPLPILNSNKSKSCIWRRRCFH